MKKLSILMLAVFLHMAAFSQTTWNVDPAHSSVTFTVSHLVISEVEGSFKKYSGTIVSSKPDFSDAVINFTVDVNSINTDNDQRDKHLKSADFFDAAKYSEMTFKSTSFKKTFGNKYVLSGDLTIKDVTKPVKFDVTFGGTAKDAGGNMRAGFKATTKINRFDYNLKWDKLTEAGGAVVGREVTINIKVEAVEKK